MAKKSLKRPAQTAEFTGRTFLNSQLAQEKKTLWLAVIAGSLSTLLMLTQWVTFSFVSEKVIVANETLTNLSGVLAILFFCIMARPLLMRIQTFLSQSASLKVRNNIRRVLLEHWRLSSPLNLKDKSTGAYATQFVEEIEAMDGYFSRYWPQQALALISPLLILSVVAYLNWVCALLLLISAPLIPLFMILVGMGAEKLNQQYSTIRQRLSGHFLDRVANLLVIKLLGAEKHIFEEVRSNSQQYRHVIMKTLKIAFLSSTVLEFFTSVAIAALAIYIGFSFYGAITWGPAQSISLFTGLTILILAPEFFQPLRNLSQFYHDRASALGAANNLVESLATGKHLEVSDKGVKDIGRSQLYYSDNLFDSDQATETQLTLSNLAIGYSQQNPVVTNLNYRLKTGQMLVISGHSGSGKTTLLNTIAGFLSPLDGTYTITPDTNAGIAYLPQRAWIKNDSIYENIAALAPHAVKTQMLEVLEKLGLADELALRHSGVDTLIGEHGKGLSGGQMQRIAFARMLLNPTPVILLDEPTAKLDTTSKKYIIDTLKAIKSKVIVIIATHDPLLINMSDIHINLDETKD